ncbi:MAG: NADH-quinone oxidoreductase subunit B/C/D [Deltaproteobacteria bacterium]|nr:NADH-quinone oxidoreductase subunit B/C/D [Deltaproteobacteria bacterium]
MTSGDFLLARLDALLNWSRERSLWPMFFGLSCCFVEEATAFTSRYDIARFGAEVIRSSPRQADLLIISGTVFKKIAPVVLRLYEQMAEPKWVMSMGSCSNTGGMYDVYSVVQGVDQILPVDVYIPGCPPRPEAVLHGLTLLQQKIGEERPARPVLGLPGGTQGTVKPVLVDGVSKSRDPRGPGYQGVPVRGSSVTPPLFPESRADATWTPPAPRVEVSEADRSLAQTLSERFGDAARLCPSTSDAATFEVAPERLRDVLGFLKRDATPRYRRLEDLTAVDESARLDRSAYPDYTLVYHLLSLEPASRLRLKVGLRGADPEAPSVTGLWPSANWYEREVYDLFGIRFEGHPNLTRLLMPPDWVGHPLRKSFPGRATQLPPYTRADAEALQPRDAGELLGEDAEGRLVLNVGPHHVGTHGLLRLVVGLDGEEVRALVPEIGYHHRGAEKIGERQTWHQFIPYTDRVDYLAGAANNLSYVLSVEALAGVRVPERAQAIRVLLAELFRLSNHLVWFGTFAHDVGAMTPTFYTFRERERILDLVELITGGRLHPAWLRIGGVREDLPDGWREALDAFVRDFPARLNEYEALVTKNPIFRRRTEGVGVLGLDEAVEWGVTGANLRACGLGWDLRRVFPYSGYERYDFDVPTADEGDCYARYRVRVEEMRQSLRILEQVARTLPGGPVVADALRVSVPPRERMLHDIETLIHHFVNVSSGPVVPRGELYHATESPRGEQGYYVVSDGRPSAYRMRIRTPGFAHVQALPLLSVGGSLSDLIAICGSVDYILPDVDR